MTPIPAHLLALQKRIEGLSPANRLRLAAALIEAGQYDLAEVLVRNSADELTALQLFRSNAPAP